MKTLALLPLIFLPVFLSAQTIPCPKGDCGRFATFINAAKVAADNRNFEEAIIQYNAAKVCCPAAAEAIDEEVLRVFKLIENEKKKADENADIAKREKAKADIALKKANTLIGHFYFTQDRAWAYKNGKFAIIDRDGNLKSKFIYDRPDNFQTNGYALVFKGKRQLLIDVEGHESPEYKSLFPTNKNGYWAQKDSGYTFTDFRGQLPPNATWYMQIDTFSDGLARVQSPKDSLWGYIEASGKLKIPAKFSDGTAFKEGMAWVQVPKKGWGLIDRNGNFVIEPIYSSGQFVASGVNFVTKSGKWGMIDKSGNYVVKPEYDEVGSFQDGMVQVWKGDKIGFVNEKGVEVIPPKFTYVTDFSEGFALVRVDSAMRNFIDKKGNFPFPSLQIEKADNFSEGLAAVKEKGKKYGYIDSTGSYKIKPQYEDAQPFSEGVAWVKKGKRQWTLINVKGDALTDTLYEEYNNFGKFAAVRLGGKWGFITTSDGKTLVSPSFKEVEIFANGYAAVQQEDELWGFVDSTGKLCIKPQYEAVNSFSEGIAAVKKDNKWSFINTKDSLITKNQFTRLIYPTFKHGVIWVVDEARNTRLLNKKGQLGDDIFYQVNSFNEGYAVAMKSNNKWGMVDSLGNEVIPFIYRRVRNFQDGLAYFTTDTSWGYINLSKEVVFSRPYKTESWQSNSYYSGSFSEGLAATPDSSKWGYIDKKGEWAIKPHYDNAQKFYDGFAIVMEGEQNLFIDMKNNVIAQCPASNISVGKVQGNIIGFYDGNYGQYGFLNRKTGEVAGPFSSSRTFADDVAWLGKYDEKGNYKMGLIDESGKCLIEPKYDDARDFEGGIAWVWEDDTWAPIDKTGKKISEAKIGSISDFSEGLARAWQDGRFGYVNRKGEFVITPEKLGLDDESDDSEPGFPTSDFSSDYYYFEDENRYANSFSGYKFSSQTEYYYGLPPSLQSSSQTGDFSNGLASIQKGNKWGYIDKNGDFKIRAEKFDWAGNFSEGLAWVKEGNKRKLITLDGSYINLSRNYNAGFPFSEGVAIVVGNEDNFGMIDRNGNEIVSLEYEALAPFSEDLAAAKKDGKWGYINRNGEEVIPPQFDAVYDFKRGRATVRKDGIYFIINKKGQLIVDENLEQPSTPRTLDDSEPPSGNR